MKLLNFFAAGLFVLLFAFPAHSSEFTGLRINTIILKDDRGRPWPNPERLMPLVVARPGTAYSSSDIRAGVQYLYLKGLFKDVRVEAFRDNGGVRLEYTLIPITVVQKVVIRGNHNMTTARIEDIVNKLEGRELREDKFPEIRAEILAIYETDGYYDVKVNFQPKPAEEPHQVVLSLYLEESAPTLVEDVLFLGNTVFPEKELLRVMQNKRGERLRTDVLLDSDMAAIEKKYADAGYPAAKAGLVDMNFRDNKAYITVSGTEGPKVTVTFSGNRAFSSKKLMRTILIWSEHDASDAIIDSSADKIKNPYRENGYIDAKVDVKKKEAPGKLDLEFVMYEGPKVSVKEIAIEGNKAFATKQIREQMDLGESGWFSSEPFREDILDKDLERIKDRYSDAGYLDATIEKKVTMSKDGRTATVLIKIAEGPQTTVGSISFEGNKALTDAELLGKLSLKPKAPFSERLLEEDRYRLLSAYSAKGFLYAKVDVEKKAAPPAEKPENKSPDAAADAEKALSNASLTIHYRITEDRPVTIGKIILRGNETTKDKTLFRELLIKPGGPYDYEAILTSQQRIYRLRYFKLVKFEPLHPGEKEYVKDMLLTVEERPAGAVDMGVGYGNLDRFRAFVEISHRNLWGGAEYASLRFEGSDILKRAIFNYQEPWFLGHKIESKFSVSWSDQKEINSKTREIYYQTRKTAWSYGVEKTFKALKTSLTYQDEYVFNYNVSPGAIVSTQDEGHVRISSLTPALVLDLRDNPFDPRKGSLHGIALKEAMSLIGSKADFTKVTAQSIWFFPLGKPTVLALSARAGMGWPHRDTQDLPINERFKLGGGNTIRGYIQDTVGPLGKDGTPQGGDGMVLFNAEVRMNPLEGLGFVLFVDAGNVWADQTIRLNDLRASYGPGIRYSTPVGPFRLDYGQKIHRQPGESPGEVTFSLGHAF